MIVKVLDCLSNQHCALAAGTVFAQQRYEGCLPGPFVLAQPFARSCLVTCVIEQVIRDLESKADIVSIAAIGNARLRRKPAHDAGGLDGKFDQGTRLELLKPSNRTDVESLAFGNQVEHLSAGHAPQARSARHLQHQFGPDKRVLVGSGIGNDLERQIVKAIAGQNRGRFIECAMHGRLSPAKIIIVHAGQIVVDQRIYVDRLDRRPRAN